jgi:hypothetical protein
MGTARPVWLILLRRVVANYTAICICASLWNIQFLDEETGVGAFVLVDTLEYLPELIGKATNPNVLIFGDLDELVIFQCVTCFFINYGANETGCVCVEDVSGPQVSEWPGISRDEVCGVLW